MAYAVLKRVLDGLAFSFTTFLLIYGFVKGYDLTELVVYNLYFLTILLTQIMHLVDITMR